MCQLQLVKGSGHYKISNRIIRMRQSKHILGVTSMILCMIHAHCQRYLGIPSGTFFFLILLAHWVRLRLFTVNVLYKLLIYRLMGMHQSLFCCRQMKLNWNSSLQCMVLSGTARSLLIAVASAKGLNVRLNNCLTGRSAKLWKKPSSASESRDKWASTLNSLSSC